MRLFFSLLAVIIALSSPVALAKDLKSYGADCEKIGFKPKTPAYGKCILELSREDVNDTPQQKEEQLSNVRAEENTNLPAGYVRTKTLGTIGHIIDNIDTSSRLDGNGTLIWSKNDSAFGSTDKGSYKYGDIFAICAAMNSSSVLGYNSGWRLPTQQELSGLYNAGTSSLIVKGWSLGRTWSSTDNAITSRGWYVVNLNIGVIFTVSEVSMGSSTPMNVTCVHQGP